MRDYSKVSTGLWHWFRREKMSDDAKMLALYVVTSPHATMAGVYACPIAYICADMGYPIERVSKGFDELHRKGFARYCVGSEMVFVCHALRHDPPTSPQHGKHIAKLCETIPSNFSFWPEFIEILQGHARLMPEGFFDRHDIGHRRGIEGASEPPRFPEPEPEPEPEPYRTSSSCTDLQAGSAPKSAIEPIPLQKNGDYIEITQPQVDEWAEAFPHLDVMQELRSLRQWCIANPGKRKTARGFQRFAVNWLTRSQDRGNGKKSKAPISDPFSWMEKTQ